MKRPPSFFYRLHCPAEGWAEARRRIAFSLLLLSGPKRELERGDNVRLSPFVEQREVPAFLLQEHRDSGATGEHPVRAHTQVVQGAALQETFIHVVVPRAQLNL